jgi:predicted sulfurtransferase
MRTLTEEHMRRLLLAAAFLLVPVVAMAQTARPAAAPPKAPKMSSDDVMTLLEKGEVFFLDVREPKELEELGTFEGYVNIPLGQIEKRLDEIPKDKAIITA